jgi:hypothetical protein
MECTIDAHLVTMEQLDTDVVGYNKVVSHVPLAISAACPAMALAPLEF